MKRFREDVSMSSRPQTSSAQPLMVGGSIGQELVANDELSYLNSVKDRFQDSKEKLDEFYDVMKDFKAQKILTVGLIERLKNLFKGHRDLALGFNTVLPKGYHITLPAEDEATPVKKPVELQDAILFVNKVKTRFQGDEHVFKAFLGILKAYRSGDKPTTEVYEEVSALFPQHPDLLVEFKQFFPYKTATIFPSNAGKSSLVRHEGNSALSSTRCIHSDKMPITLHDHGQSIDQADVDPDRDSNLELANTNFDHKGQEPSQNLKSSMNSRPQTSSAQPLMVGGSNRQELVANDALSYLDSVQVRFQDSKEKWDEFLDVMKDFKAQRIDTVGLTERLKSLFKGHQDLALGFNTFLPKGYHITLPAEDEASPVKKPVEFQEAIHFVNNVKARFEGEDHVYKAFLNILNVYRNENKPITEVYEEVSDLFCLHPDLLVEFKQFLPHRKATILPSKAGKSSLVGHEGNSALSSTRRLHSDKMPITLHANHGESIYEADVDPNRDSNLELENRNFDHKRQQPSQNLKSSSRIEDAAGEHFLKSGEYRETSGPEACSSSDESTRPQKVEDREKLSDRESIDGQKDREQGSERVVAFVTSNVTSQRMSCRKKDKYAAKPIHDLDLSDCDQCTPGYRLLPTDYPIPLASQRTEIGKGVLNDNWVHWVSATSESEDYSSKPMRKNQYEERLFRCEDDRYELDMMLGSAQAATKRVEDLLNKIADNSVATDSNFNINDHLTALNLRFIERIYGDDGLDVMDALKKNAPPMLPVILTRLKQKQEELARCRADFKKVWAEIYAKNHKKSLDYRRELEYKRKWVIYGSGLIQRNNDRNSKKQKRKENDRDEKNRDDLIVFKILCPGLGLLIFLNSADFYSVADEMVGLSLFDVSNDCYFHTSGGPSLLNSDM